MQLWRTRALYESLARRMAGDSVALSFIAEFPLEPASLETPWPTSIPRKETESMASRVTRATPKPGQ